jgi:8-amino-7-oxononanoate synthase
MPPPVALSGPKPWASSTITQAPCCFAVAQIGLTLMDSPTPIQPVLVGSSERALRLSALLRERGILVGAIRPPTVPAGSARLRITFTAAHSDAQLERLLEALAECWALLPKESDDA